MKSKAAAHDPIPPSGGPRSGRLRDVGLTDPKYEIAERRVLLRAYLEGRLQDPAERRRQLGRYEELNGPPPPPSQLPPSMHK